MDKNETSMTAPSLNNYTNTKPLKFRYYSNWKFNNGFSFVLFSIFHFKDELNYVDYGFIILNFGFEITNIL